MTLVKFVHDLTKLILLWWCAEIEFDSRIIRLRYFILDNVRYVREKSVVLPVDLLTSLF